METTRERYLRALSECWAMLARSGLVWSDLSSEQRDWLMAKVVVQLHEDEEPHGNVATLLAALQKISHEKLLVSWQVRLQLEPRARRGCYFC